MLRAVGRRLPAISGLTRNTSPSSSLALVSSDALRDDTVISSANLPQGLQLLNTSSKSHFLFRGFSSESLAPRHELGFSDIPATIAAVKNPTSKIEYDESNHERFAPGDPSKRAFTYFVLTGGRFVYASFIRLLVLKFILSMSASKDVLAMASLEVDLSSIESGSTVTVKWRGKPVFIRRRTEDDIQLANSVNVNSLRDPQQDSERVQNPEWLVVIGVCTHLGCVPLPNAGDYGGWFCPCHGSHYDISGRIRKGPAPYNLEVPTYKFLEDNKMLIGCERSVLIKNMLEDVGESDQSIPLANVSSAVLRKVIEYCEHHRGEPLPSADADQNQDETRKRTTDISEWDQKFITVDQEMLFEIILAANYLDIKSLLDVGCKTVANMIKGKTPDEIRRLFNIVNDFTPEEEAQIKKENEWAEDR